MEELWWSAAGRTGLSRRMFYNEARAPVSSPTWAS